MSESTPGERLARNVAGAFASFREQVGSLAPDPDDERRKSVLFNDITFATTRVFIPLSDRQAIADHLWAQGWRRNVRPEDVTE